MPPQPPPPSAPDVGRLLLLELGHAELAPDVAARPPLVDWAESGLMHLTRDESGRPLRPRGLPATVARGAAGALVAVSRARFGRAPAGGALDGARLLAERTALAATPPEREGGAPEVAVSRGGRARFVRGQDGWWVLHLARGSDVELVPALVERELAGDSIDEAWTAVTEWAAARPAAEAVRRAVLLGLPAAVPAETPPPATPWSVRMRPATPRAGEGRGPGRVVNLGALWAAPLAAQLLGEVGFEVVHVESTDRPDASRWGDPDLHALLHTGSETVQLDFGSTDGRARLRQVVSSADVVIEASRPRALEALGVAPRDVLADGRSRTWLQLTAHGPHQPLRVGFGDDAAVAGGLVAEHPDGTPAFSGDALADPLSGLVGALVVTALHEREQTTVASLSLAGVAAWCRAAGDVEWPAELPAAALPSHR